MTGLGTATWRYQRRPNVSNVAVLAPSQAPKAVIETWRVDYNTVRLHSSLKGATPEQVARITAGARRLTPARPDESRQPDDLSLSV